MRIFGKNSNDRGLCLATTFLAGLFLLSPVCARADTGANDQIAIDMPAPDFTLPDQNGKPFKLSDRKGTWTVVYFYPKADSPGCTEQACAFRDAIKKIESRNGKLVGISADSQDSQKKFHNKHNLSFDLLADSDSKVISQYGVKVPLIGVARRTTFIVDPELKIRSIARDVDPAFDAEWTAETLDELQSDTSKPSSAPAKPVTPSSGKTTKPSSGKAK